MRIVRSALSSALLLTLAGCPPSASTVPVAGGGSGSSTSRGHGSSTGKASSASSTAASSSTSSSSVGTSTSSSTSTGAASSSGSTGSSASGSSSSSSSSGSTGTRGSSSGSSGAACVLPLTDGGCWADQPDGELCVTLADCESGLVCLYNPGCYTGFCQSPLATPTLACVPNFQPCAAGSLCCGGECRSGVCAPWSPCGEVGASCQSDLDCCNDFACQAGTCQPTCGQIYSACQVNGDCCEQEGLLCNSLAGDLTSAICYPGNPSQPLNASGDPILCGAPCSAWECQLGAACEVADGVDPCHAAGLVCDASAHV